MFSCQETGRELGISGNTVFIPRLSLWRSLFESNQIKEQHERMKLQNEDVMLKNVQNFGN